MKSLSVFFTLVFLCVNLKADTPPGASVKSWVYDSGGNTISSTTGALNSYITNSSLPVTFTSSIFTPIYSELVYGGVALNPQQRIWTLSNSTDSVQSYQGGTWSVGLTGGTVTANIGTTGGLALDATLSSLSAKFNSLGQKTSANSSPVVLASDQSAIPVQVQSTVAAPDFSASGSLTAACTTPTSCPGGSTVTISNVSALGNAILELQGTWSGTVIVEGSNDSGATWNARSIIQTAPAQLSNAGVSINGYYRITGVGAYKQLRARMTVFNSGSATTVLNASIGTDVTGIINTNPNNLLMSAGAPNAIVSYGACITNLTISATPTDIFTIQGSATKVVTVLRLEISGTETTVSMHEFDLIIRSSQNSGGTFTNPTPIANDQNNAAGTAVVTAYTVSPASLGTTVGTIWSKKFVIPATTGVDSSWPQFFDFGEYSQGVVLRGTSQVLALSDNALAIAGSSLNICVRWTEQ